MFLYKNIELGPTKQSKYERWELRSTTYDVHKKVKVCILSIYVSGMEGGCDQGSHDTCQMMPMLSDQVLPVPQQCSVIVNWYFEQIKTVCEC